ncbi:hypothetical protein [Streptomyces sp. NPDC093261]|uniref:hypothetical protein n=1 Tax=Streptomyces sp. NPDC093261 TaxID=3366037 RepID=UPI00380F573A
MRTTAKDANPFPLPSGLRLTTTSIPNSAPRMTWQPGVTLGRQLAFMNCHRSTAFRPGAERDTAYREFSSVRAAAQAVP